MVRILFVCLGNICRSPCAEGVFRKLVADAGLAAQVEVDSAGTGDWHAGEPPDPRMARAAARMGYPLEHRARQVRVRDFYEFDQIWAMDASNLRSLERMRPQDARAQLQLFRSLEGNNLDVPDPYYGDAAGFSQVVKICEDNARVLVERLKLS